jgi:ABC-type multidrug transport system ATPase subunit
MAQATISQIRLLVRTMSYVVSTHAAEELEDDRLTLLDLENIILTGQIIARQRDARTREVKFVIAGTSCEGASAEVVAKIGPTGRLIIITVYAC